MGGPKPESSAKASEVEKTKNATKIKPNCFGTHTRLNALEIVSCVSNLAPVRQDERQ
jgi:hypothetical protein